MTTFTWGNTVPPLDWADAADWSADGSSPAGPPGSGDVAVVDAGTVDLEMALNNVQAVLRGSGLSDAAMVATDVDLGDNFVLSTASISNDAGDDTYKVVGIGALDDSNRINGLTPRAGVMNFTAAPLTIDLAAGATFVDKGTMTGLGLAIISDDSSAAQTFENDSTIEITGAIMVGAGVTLTGGGVVELDGTIGNADILGAVGADQTFRYVNVPGDNTLHGTMTIADLSTFKGAVVLSKGNEISLPGMDSAERRYSGGVLTFENGQVLRVTTSSGANNVRVLAGTGQTLVLGVETVACFAEGTRIRTPCGDVPVERLRVGDPVFTAFDGAVPVRWLGNRLIECRRHPRPWDTWPVRVAEHAFGDGQPARELFLSPDHAVFVGGMLFPIRYLVNGATIVQIPVGSVTYWHVELDRHDVIFAEGLPCETYLDTGNRGAFANGGSCVQIHPDFARSVWEMNSCAPLVLQGARLVAAKRHLLARATGLGHVLTEDPSLSGFVGDRQLPTQGDRTRLRIQLPRGTENLRVVSRIWTPAHARADESDTRSLGVAISRLWLDGREVSLESSGLTTGWHLPEPGWRWTDGDAQLALTDVRELAFEVAMSGTYWQDQDGGGVRAARSLPMWANQDVCAA